MPTEAECATVQLRMIALASHPDGGAGENVGHPHELIYTHAKNPKINSLSALYHHISYK